MSATKIKGPAPANNSKRNIFKYAEEVAKKHNYNINENDVFKIIEFLGGKIEKIEPMGSFESDDASLIVKQKGDFIVRLSVLCGDDRNRFSAAHELGHYLLHYFSQNRQDEMHAARSGDVNDRAEWEANWFASAFLMPEVQYRKIHKDEIGNFDAISCHFRVSRRAAEVRALVLDLKKPIK